MKLIKDCFGRAVRLTDERLAHILEHAEMVGMEDEVERILQRPSEVRVSRSDDQGFFPKCGKLPSESVLERLNRRRH